MYKSLVKVNYDITSIKNKIFNILVIDNNEKTLKKLQLFLKERGHKVTIKTDGANSLYCISKNNFNMIFIGQIEENNLFTKEYLIECIKEIKDTLILAYSDDKLLKKPKIEIDLVILTKFFNIIEKYESKIDNFEEQIVHKLEKKEINKLRKSLVLY